MPLFYDKNDLIFDEWLIWLFK